MIILHTYTSITLLGIGIDNKLNFEKHLSIIIPCYIFLSRQYSLLYLYLCIVNVFKYLTLSVNKKSYSHYYIKDVRFSLDPLPRSSSFLLTYILLQNNCINNGVTNGLKFKKKKNFPSFSYFSIWEIWETRKIFAIIVKMQNICNLIVWKSVLISDIFNCYGANINGMWNPRKLGGVCKTFEFTLT